MGRLIGLGQAMTKMMMISTTLMMSQMKMSLTWRNMVRVRLRMVWMRSMCMLMLMLMLMMKMITDAEEREMAARLFALAGINDRGVEFVEHHGGHSQDTWEEVDPDELSYEELLALGEVVGTESRGLSADTIANLPSVTYKTGSNQSGTSDSCVICRLDFEDEEAVTVLSCKHSYHAECINNWLKINKVCPVCSAEVSTSGGSQASS
ncbi:E3 ubiquitin ligase BIG BROTHER-related [Linum grandiflorum]